MNEPDDGSVADPTRICAICFRDILPDEEVIHVVPIGQSPAAKAGVIDVTGRVMRLDAACWGVLRRTGTHRRIDPS